MSATTTTATPLPSVIYARISSDPGHDAEGVARQVEDGIATNTRQGWALAADPFVDNDMSATKGRYRPRFDALMAMVRRGEAGVVICYATSRLVRNRRERAETFQVFADHGVGLVCTGGQSLDFSTSSGRVLAGILGELDTFEVEQMSERIVRANLQRAQEGRPGGSPRPYGFVSGTDRTVVETEAAVIRMLKDAVLAGASLRGLTAELNDRGIPTVRGGAWGNTSIRSILTNPGIAGIRRYKEVEYEGTWDGIVSVADYRRLVRLLGANTQPEGWSNKPVHVLSGIARCGKCGARVHGRVSKSRRSGRDYVCLPRERGGCRGIRRDANQVDAFVEAVVHEMLADPAVVTALAVAGSADAGSADAEEVIAVQQAVEAWQARAVALGEEMKGDDPGDEVARLMRRGQADGIRRELAGLRARQAQLARSTAADGLLGLEDIAGHWPTLPMARKRAVIAALVEVTLLPVGRGGRAGVEHVRIERRPHPGS